jgi:tRNA-specific 2-thiouridylase
VGQRRGLNISLGRRTYVAAINPVTNEILLANDDDIFHKEIRLNSLNYLVPLPLAPFDAQVKIRHSRRLDPARISPEGGDTARIEFGSPVRAPAPGQTAVFYRQDGLVIGSGIIISEPLP